MENFTMVDFNYFDVTISAIVLLLGIKGFMNGFIKEIFGLAGLVAGVYFGSRFADTSAAFISNNFLQMQNPTLLKLLGFLAILIIVWLSATLLGSILSKLTSASGLGFINRLFGFIAGGGKYFIIFALIVTALSNVTLVKENLGKYVNNSVLYPHLIEVGSKIIHLNPASLGLGDASKTEMFKEVANLKESKENNGSTESNASTAAH
ncbi:CvpA family protein [Sulfurovum sp. NBC37-1]|uniref:CvpA family protein n=1 Tax=Sulfurovum sp. (strain NBC37-1) TaxID=387093 RepID=UPI00015874B0|nr:CvpA family protein [Sulfurovum sp. NBC37-1]BAF71444.1 colicin V production protein [Sulfurovum sp. NBC37-1]